MVQVKKASLYIALFVSFMDFMGFAIVWPIFPSLLFDTSNSLLSSATSSEMRGVWLGILLSLAPLSQFLTMPVWGAISDNLGRKKPLLFSLIITCLGNICAFLGVYFFNLIMILLSRVIIGLASGNISIVQATIADISRPDEKTKNFGLFSMMVGLGFTIGPLTGGLFSAYGYTTAFMIVTLLGLLNFIFALLLFQETLPFLLKTKIDWKAGVINLKKAFEIEGLRIIFISSFLANFAWVFFVEFIPVYLIKQFHFTSTSLGLFFGIGSGAYAFNSGVLIRPLSKWLKAEMIFFGGLFLSGVAILSILLSLSLIWMWILIILMFSFCSYLSPSCSTLVSNKTSEHIQGEALGVLGSVYAIATIISSLFSGSLVGSYPTLPIWGGGIVMLVTALIFFFFYPDFSLRKKILLFFGKKTE
jgi:MFS transporter, DHA1 family, tetracycline resistance protein